MPVFSASRQDWPNEKGPRRGPRFHIATLHQHPSADQTVEVPGSVCQDGGIEDLTAARALPSVKGSDKVIIFLGKHSTFAFWAFHI